ncbi:MAG: SH3 domain-containing protein [Lachnospiraceae bacterium]|nr:SH3 domain-containing protein [Lachnospiraceae bacterium]
MSKKKNKKNKNIEKNIQNEGTSFTEEEQPEDTQSEDFEEESGYQADPGLNPEDFTEKDDESSDEQDDIDETGEISDDKWNRVKEENARIRSRNRLILIIIVSVVALVLIILLGVAISHKLSGRKGVSDNSVSGSSLSADSVSDNGVIPVTSESLKENAFPEVNDLVNRYFAARTADDLVSGNVIRGELNTREAAKIEARNIYVEAYQNLNCYTKPGPYTGSYVAFVTYDLKLKDWEQTAPGLITLLICPDDNGVLYVYTGDFEENAAEYIRQVSVQSDVADLLNRIDTQYNEILDGDKEFATYMSSLNELIKNSVGEILAEAAAEASVSDNTVSGNSVSSDSASANAAGYFTVIAAETVNVRVSDSENADRIGQVAEGTELVCHEQKDNGWSEIEYDGKVGYIKSEYLKKSGEETDTPADTGADKVTIKESVNVRDKASTDGEKLGLAYAGESYEVVTADKNGWTAINYKGNTGYIKTEYIQK